MMHLRALTVMMTTVLLATPDVLAQEMTNLIVSVNPVEGTNDLAAVKPVRAYTLVPDDTIEMKVYRHGDLDTRARLAEDGTVVLPLLGSIAIGGKTADEARQTIRGLLAKDYLVNPQVSLSVVEYAKRLITVMGEVQRPGTFELPHDQVVNLLQAIAMAGGYTRLGAPGKVVVQRMENGQKQIFRINTGSMVQNVEVQPFNIRPGDTITVGERTF
jgi:polysaccharide export outer membrane protein